MPYTTPARVLKSLPYLGSLLPNPATPKQLLFLVAASSDFSDDRDSEEGGEKIHKDSIFSCFSRLEGGRVRFQKLDENRGPIEGGRAAASVPRARDPRLICEAVADQVGLRQPHLRPQALTRAELLMEMDPEQVSK